MKSHVLLIVLPLLFWGCCSHGSKECEEGVSITVLYDKSSRIEDMKIRYEGGKATYRPKENSFYIEETSDSLGESVTLEIVLDDAVISNRSHSIEWNRAVCNKADGPRWCADDTYEWAELTIDLREADNLDDK